MQFLGHPSALVRHPAPNEFELGVGGSVERFGRCKIGACPLQRALVDPAGVRLRDIGHPDQRVGMAAVRGRPKRSQIISPVGVGMMMRSWSCATVGRLS